MRGWVGGAVLVLLLAAPAARAGDITIFGSNASPEATWARGYGAALSSQWFHLVAIEGEAARQPGEIPETSMTTFTGSALLSPPIGLATLYGGFGFGLFRQKVADQSDTGTFTCFVAGLKLHIGGLVVLKGEYRKYHLSGEPPMPLDHRYSLGAGISF